MNRLTLLTIMIIGVFASNTIAQEYGTAFRVGLNFTRFIAPSETGTTGDLEEFSSSTGFHVAGGIIFKLLENYGVKAEVMFTQVGGRYRYEGESVLIYTPPFTTEPVLSSGTRTTTLRITNSYIQLPVVGYAKLGKLEFQLGASIGFLISSNGIGTFRYEGKSANGMPIEPYAISLDHNYIRNELLTLEDLQNPDLERLDPFFVDGQTVTLPATFNAYDTFSEKDGRFYNTVDLGLVGGVSYYLNKGLFVGLRVNYGLLDASNDFYDFSKRESNGLEPISRSDKDSNLSFETSIGFSF